MLKMKIDEYIELNGDVEVEDTEWIEHDAYFDDVTFDGNQDLLIHIGSWGSSQFYCAFIYDNETYRREESFETIPDYEVDADKQQIVGHGGTINTDITTIYTYSNGKFECIDRIEEDK